jgi:hypothetical protein
VDVDLQADAHSIKVDPVQLESAVVNLAVNARDAMPLGGSVLIAVRNVGITPLEASSLELAPGDYVRLEVQDTGEGMDEETISKAFDPFYTTKEVGKGTGLGLSQVYGFVKQSNGVISIRSQLGRGTSVQILFPAFRGEAVSDQAEEAPPEIEPGRSLSILVVEDDDRVRAVSAQALQELGHEVTAVGGGTEALAILEGGKAFDVMFQMW